MIIIHTSVWHDCWHECFIIIIHTSVWHDCWHECFIITKQTSMLQNCRHYSVDIQLSTRAHRLATHVRYTSVDTSTSTLDPGALYKWRHRCVTQLLTPHKLTSFSRHRLTSLSWHTMTSPSWHQTPYVRHCALLTRVSHFNTIDSTCIHGTPRFIAQLYKMCYDA